MGMKCILHKIENKTAVVGIVGLGYVGLPLGLSFANRGFQVLGFDINATVVDQINDGVCPISNVESCHDIAVLGKTLVATDSVEDLGETDAIIICVPTPLLDDNTPDLSYVIRSVESVLPHVKPQHVICLESTTYPGTTEEEIVSRVQGAGYTIGTDIFVAYSPEREDPGNAVYNTMTIPKLCAGYTDSCLQVATALYQSVIDKVIPVSSLRVAEMAKILENVHRAVNIGLVNEMKIVADKMGIDIYEVINAAATKPFGFTPYYPGPGLGGHCIPVDPFYLTYKAKQYGINTDFIELAGKVNTHMPAWVVDKTVSALAAQGVRISNSKILLLGLAYKPNVADCRETPSAELLHLFTQMGAVVAYSDPYVSVFPKMRKYAFDLKSVAITAHTLSSYDAVVIATNHDNFDYDMILQHATLIIDTRGVYTHVTDMALSQKVCRA